MTSADACKQECEATDGCKGYTWKTDSTQCWLKSSVDEYVYDALSASGDCNGGIVIDNEGGTDNVDIGSVPAGATVWSQLRARIKLNKDNPSVPCSEINTTEDFCCWWPQAFTCGTCEKCSAGWGACPHDLGHQCSGSPTPAPPSTRCDGPKPDEDNGGTNMNNGETTPSADDCKLLCDVTQDCKGYTWKTDSKECWLKSEVGPYETDDLSASGGCR